MDISFKSIAFELKYNSCQIDSVYSVLGIMDKGPQKFALFTLQQLHPGFLPLDFRDYIMKLEDTPKEPINILFEHNPRPDERPHNDWDLFYID